VEGQAIGELLAATLTFWDRYRWNADGMKMEWDGEAAIESLKRI
jgi:hypothetical protein